MFWHVGCCFWFIAPRSATRTHFFNYACSGGALLAQFRSKAALLLLTAVDEVALEMEADYEHRLLRRCLHAMAETVMERRAMRHVAAKAMLGWKMYVRRTGVIMNQARDQWSLCGRSDGAQLLWLKVLCVVMMAVVCFDGLKTLVTSAKHLCFSITADILAPDGGVETARLPRLARPRCCRP